MKRLIVCLLIFAGFLFGSEDERLNTLPIGPSQYKHDQVTIEADQIVDSLTELQAMDFENLLVLNSP